MVLSFWVDGLQSESEQKVEQRAFVETQIHAIQTRMASLQSDRRWVEHLGRIQDTTASPPIVHLTHQITHCLPPQAVLSSVRFNTDRNIMLLGKTSNEAEIYEIVSYLRRLPGIELVALLATNSGGNEDQSQFEMRLSWRPEATDSDHAFTQLEDEFDQTQSRDTRLQRIETKLQFLQKSVTPQRIPEVRDPLITMIREGGGSLRTLEIEDGQKRRWADQDDDPRSRRLPDYGSESQFELHSHAISLLIVGPLETVLAIVDKSNDYQWLMSTDSLDLKPSAGNAAVLSLDIKMTLFGLLHAPIEHDDTFAMIHTD